MGLVRLVHGSHHIETLDMTNPSVTDKAVKNRL